MLPLPQIALAIALALSCVSPAAWASKGCPQETARECPYQIASTVVAITDEVTESCIAVDPGNAERYRAGSKREIKDIEANSREPLDVLRASPYYSNARKYAHAEQEKTTAEETLARCRQILKQEDSKQGDSNHPVGRKSEAPSDENTVVIVG